MKKAVTTALTAIFVATSMCGCGKDAASSAVRIETPSDTQQAQTQQEIENKDNINDNNGENIGKKIQIIIDSEKIDGITGKARKKSPISGVRRHFIPDQSGNYTVEYIHTPYGIDKDETLDYNLSLNNDNTFELTVVSNGVTANHSGRWYERRGQLMLFYDEEIKQQPHNVYVADSMYCELLPHGKVMFYDNCYTIVLTKQQNEYEIMPISNK